MTDLSENIKKLTKGTSKSKKPVIQKAAITKKTGRKTHKLEGQEYERTMIDVNSKVIEKLRIALAGKYKKDFVSQSHIIEEAIKFYLENH